MGPPDFTPEHSVSSATRRPAVVVLGLRENWRQFWLLVLVNAFVGAMVGLERAVLPLVASEDFGLTSASVILSFIAAFGLAKACSNLLAGWLVERRGRRWTLVAGWVFALPVPVVVLYAPTWWWIVAASRTRATIRARPRSRARAPLVHLSIHNDRPPGHWRMPQPRGRGIPRIH